MTTQLPISMQRLIEKVQLQYNDDKKVCAMFEKCFTNTYETTIRPQEDETTFVITGDIPAMWLRDSAAQVRPYLLLAESDAAIADMIQGVIQKQMTYINHDPYANAFNETPNNARYNEDETEMTPWIWERKYEIDSLCYPVQLAYLFWKSTGRTEHFNHTFQQAIRAILDTFKIEQDHASSDYHFVRHDCPQQDTLSHQGYGAPVGYTGMTWSGFRPSDDACVYGYLVPANMFAVVILGYISEIAEEIVQDSVLAKEATALQQVIDKGIQQYGVVDHPTHGKIYAYETDGLGHYILMDDANVPNLLSIPYLGYSDKNDEIYQNTREFILSSSNPYYYEGKYAKGIGSPHTPENYIWHIALAMEGMTEESRDEKEVILEMLKQTDAGTDMMHEGFDVDNPNQFTREWFSWANSMFSEFILRQCGMTVKGSPLVEKERKEQ
ncbi:MAG TPA: glycoside hydrolase family 125 protein [Virgibacillus sp.]|nr:glycoside hydrolase family 125 protein [Virgibacillus sp.]